MSGALWIPAFAGMTEGHKRLERVILKGPARMLGLNCLQLRDIQGVLSVDLDRGRNKGQLDDHLGVLPSL